MHGVAFVQNALRVRQAGQMPVIDARCKMDSAESRIAIVTNAFDSAGPPAIDALVAEGYLTLCHSSSFSDPRVRSGFESNGPNRFASSATTEAELTREALE